MAVEEEGGASTAETTSAAAADLLVPPQNVMCPHFPEFWGERHILMAHFARRAADEGDDAVLVVGAEHADELAGILASTDDDNGGSEVGGEEGERDEELYGGGGGGGRGGDGGVFFHQEQQVIDDLLGAGKGGSGSGTNKVHLMGVDMGVEMEVELEKRAALAAMLVSTQTFPPHAALPPAEELGEEARAIVARVYPKYRNVRGEESEVVVVACV